MVGAYTVLSSNNYQFSLCLPTMLCLLQTRRRSAQLLSISNLRPFLSLYRKLHQQFESYKEQVKKMGEESKQAQDQKNEAPTCGICHKTKFADGCGHLCSYCQTKFCARCGGRVSLRSNKVTLAHVLGPLVQMPPPSSAFSLHY